MTLPRVTILPAIPAVPSRLNDGILATIKAMKEIIEAREGTRGTNLDKAMTLRDAVDIGLVSYNGNDYSSTRAPTAFGIISPPVIVPDMTTPPTPTGFSASSGMATAILSWTDPTIANAIHAFTEVWRSTSNNLAVAVKVGTSAGFMFSDPLGATGVTYYYWIRFVSTSDVAGPYNAGTTGGSLVTSGLVGGVDLTNLIIDSAKLANSAVTSTKIANLAVGSAAIADLAVTNGKIGDLAVDSAKIAALAVTTAKINDLAVSAAKIASATITAAQIADATITTAKIGSAQVTTLLIGANQVTVPVITTAYVYAATASWYSPTTSYYEPVNTSITLAYAGDIIVQFSCASYFYGALLNEQIKFYIWDGTTYIVPVDSYLTGYSGFPSGACTILNTHSFIGKMALSAGTKTIKAGIKRVNSTAICQVGNFAMTLVGAYR